MFSRFAITISFVGVVVTIILLSIYLPTIGDDGLVKDKIGGPCDDSNQCTEDYRFDDGCKNYYSNRIQPCDTNCYYDTGVSTTCDGFGDCVGLNCSGNCVDADDCIDIFEKGVIQCNFNQCIYIVGVDSPLETPAYGGILYDEMCFEAIPATYSGCLDITTYVMSANSSQADTKKSNLYGSRPSTMKATIVGKSTAYERRMANQLKYTFPRSEEQYYADNRRNGKEEYYYNQRPSNQENYLLNENMNQFVLSQNGFEFEPENVWCNYKFGCGVLNIKKTDLFDPTNF